MKPLWEMQQFIEYDDILAWRDEVGVRKGVVYGEWKSSFQSVAGPPS
jgi:hypothetical protein